MGNYKLTIRYDGERYKGWQRLGNTENTIQGKIENALNVLVGHPVEIIGSSRTDAGVHAFAQVANFKSESALDESKIKHFLNHYLPRDISITEVELVDERFHARYNAREKTYLYKIWNSEYLDPFERKYSMHVAKKLYIKSMRQACFYFLGEHDFTAYTNSKSKKKDMVRVIHFIELEQEGDLVFIRICGNGFLYNMVRKIVGTLIAVGLGEKTPDEVEEIIASGDRSKTGVMADACGLYLERIEF